MVKPIEQPFACPCSLCAGAAAGEHRTTDVEVHRECVRPELTVRLVPRVAGDSSQPLRGV
jgi:hypothetical protein